MLKTQILQKGRLSGSIDIALVAEIPENRRSPPLGILAVIFVRVHAKLLFSGK